MVRMNQLPPHQRPTGPGNPPGSEKSAQPADRKFPSVPNPVKNPSAPTIKEGADRLESEERYREMVRKVAEASTSMSITIPESGGTFTKVSSGVYASGGAIFVGPAGGPGVTEVGLDFEQDAIVVTKRDSYGRQRRQLISLEEFNRLGASAKEAFEMFGIETGNAAESFSKFAKVLGRISDEMLPESKRSTVAAEPAPHDIEMLLAQIEIESATLALSGDDDDLSQRLAWIASNLRDKVNQIVPREDEESHDDEAG